MPAKVTAYLSSDGKLFTSEKEAEIHEATRDLREHLNSMRNSPRDVLDAEVFVNCFLRSSPSFCKALRALLDVL